MRRKHLLKFIEKRVIALIFPVALALPAWGANPEVKIANGPLFSGRGNVHPNMLLNLSVEFPTAGIAYRGDSGTYNRNYEYVGYFNPLKCYYYNGGNRNLTDSQDLDTAGYFYIAKNADPKTHECGGDSFSGNFMNWAASSAIDMLRYALTGGDRVYDKLDGTVLQRAFLKEDFYAHNTYFPRRIVTGGGNVSAPNQVTPFKGVATLYIVSCRNRILFSDLSSGSVDSKDASNYCTSVFDKTKEDKEDTKDKRLGEYLVRVKVCDSKEGAERKDLCLKYGSNYKPVGAIQRNSEKLRLGAMGYLLDDAETRYGGVLRAPMKYVGPKKLEAPDYIEVDNDKPEWDPATGRLYSNPDNPADRDSSVLKSGVINYLNKFGYSGKYKRFDPIGELYYEGIRYLQGKSPTIDATAGMTEAMKDGFPVITTWMDPLIASCPDNYIVTIADVNTHWDRYIPGNTRTKFGNSEDAHDAVRPVNPSANTGPEPDVMVWTERVGKMESDGAYFNPQPNGMLTNLHNRDTGSSGHGTYYMAGLAYWANTNDIRTDKPTRVKTFTIDVDEGGNGLIDGNTRSLKPRNSQLYLAAKYGGFADRNKDGNPFVTSKTGAEGKKIDIKNNEEWDKDGNGVPDTYFLAGQPKEMIKSIQEIFKNIGDPSGSISGVSVSTARISTDGTFIFQPGFISSKWSGSLRKLALTLDADGAVNIDTTAKWDAGDVLTGTGMQDAKPKAADRKIYTSKIDAGKPLVTVEFKWDKLTDAQKALLNTSPIDATNDGAGAERLNFLRGERSLEVGQENGIFRARDRVLGDIINSTPVYVGAPSMNAQGAGYQKFYEDNKGRTKAVYVGANDGMLHAFSADDGTELFAYVPNTLIKHLSQLTYPDYVHRPYVDGGMTVAEAHSTGKWKTVLASGMGGGAQGVFALDVSNPSDFSSGSGAIWEFTDADDPDMGNVMGAPVIAKFRVATEAGGFEYKYFAVVSSGLNNYKDDGKNANGTGKFNADGLGALFLLSLDKDPAEKWTPNKNYFKFRTLSNVAALQNGLSSPALVVDSHGVVLYAYSGDLQGNLWRFDFTAIPNKSAPLTGEVKPLFTATDTQGIPQPITVQPKVVFAPGGGYVVLFGTGKFVENADAVAGNFKVQSYYGIYDTVHKDYSVSDRSQLASRTLEQASGSESSSDDLNISGDAFSYGSADQHKKGWYFDFLDSGITGERSVTNALVADGSLFFNSLIPSKDPCATGGGRSYMLDVLTGLPSSSGNVTGFRSQVGMLSAPIRLETGIEVSERNAIGRRLVKKKHAVINFGTGRKETTGELITVEPAGNGQSSLPAGRFSWREIMNWQELRNALSAKK